MMKARHIICMAALAVCSNMVMAQAPAWPELNDAQKPGARWWWMGSAVDKDNTDKLMQEYGRVGLGTMEITPIYSVQNAKNNIMFLSQAWFEQLANVQAAGKANNIQIDMNMGTGWPFGGPSVTLAQAAGKLVYTRNSVTTTDDALGVTIADLTASNSAVTASSQVKTGTPASDASLNKVMAFNTTAATRVAGDTIDVTGYVSGKKLTWTAPHAGTWMFYAVYNDHTKQQVKRAAPGGEGYVMDHLDSAAVASYIKVFENAFTKYGAQYPTCFFNDSYEIYNADWSPKYFEEFEKYRGYKLQNYLPSLFGVSADKLNGVSNQIRSDYRETMGDMYINNFVKQWNDFCHRHGVLTRNQSHGSPSNLIDTYASVDIPEIEGYGMTTLNIKGLRKDAGFTAVNSSDFPTLKLAASAAHVKGKNLVSSETFTWFTEHFRTSLSQMKPELDLMFLAGVNRIMFHGTTYSPVDAAWPGNKFYASMDMSPTNSIWYDAPQFMKYAQRCQSFLQMGQPDNDALMYFNVYSSWHQKGTTILKLCAISDFKSQYSNADSRTDSLDAHGISTDFITDKMIRNLKYEGGKIVTESGAQYKALVMPSPKSSMFIPADVQAKLDELVAEGANVVYVDNVSTKKFVAEVQKYVTGEPMREKLGLRFIRRSNASGHHYFITNLTSEDIAAYTPLNDSFTSAVLFNPMDSTMKQALVNENGEVYLHLRSGESVILQTYNYDVTSKDLAKDVDEANLESSDIALDGAWTLSFNDAKLADASNYSKTYSLAAPQTWETLDDNTAQLMGQGTYTTSVNVSDETLKDASDVKIILGDVRESARVNVNGKYVGTSWAVPFELSIGKYLKAGSNTIAIEVTNLPANRIRQMDVNGTVWRIFEDANISTISSTNNVGTTATSFAGWKLVPSGLNGAVSLKVIKDNSTGVATIAGESAVTTTNEWYNINGMRVTKPTMPGIYVNNHRKVVMR